MKYRALSLPAKELGEIDARKLYRDEGCSSLFSFCTEMLHMSESMAWLRIRAARAARKFPVILDRLAAGELTLSNSSLLNELLTPENHLQLLDAVRHQSKRGVEKL